jgi:hypothetical protein
MAAEITGIRELTDYVRVVSDRVDTESKKLVWQVAVATAEQIKRNAHSGEHPKGKPHIPGTGPGPNKVTGALIDSVKVEGPVGGAGFYEATATVGAFYAPFLEFGRTGKTGAARTRAIKHGRGSIRRQFNPPRRRSAPEGGNPGQYPFIGPARTYAQRVILPVLSEQAAKRIVQK